MRWTLCLAHGKTSYVAACHDVTRGVVLAKKGKCRPGGKVWRVAPTHSLPDAATSLLKVSLFVPDVQAMGDQRPQLQEGVMEPLLS